MTKAKWTIMTAAMLLWPATVLALSPQERCDGARIKAWRKFVSCVEVLVVKDAQALPVNPSPLEALAKCRHKYFSTWVKVQGAAYASSSCIGSRFTGNGDQTVTDHLSGLVWERKDNLNGVGGLSVPHDADNQYTWSVVLPYEKEDGTAFTSFLTDATVGLNVVGFAGSFGWRLPTLAELQTIVLDFPCTAVSCACPSSPCVDPALDASNTQPGAYWSATNSAVAPSHAWLVEFLSGGEAGHGTKLGGAYVRAVRGGW